ncbi:sulfite exporter TauE/SafE family protein [Pantoea stewartii]|uniref:sulfite exporter TauE/SafE family protein n=1 Tax=Pantoea stewartii TaxID=66269 RepID=UPI002DB9FBE4|nr:sulfite exporter TauE/SafE family protein [Pantoea stewartii]MEB6537091.1 sulfite exporter TauE/SafE family protein [Pantoea stewartii]
MVIQEFTHLSVLTVTLLIATGIAVGFFLALTGGGGSVVCVPLLLYLVKVPDLHRVIGTSAIAVAVSALINLYAHGRKGHVRWATGATISLVAVAGALIGAGMGKHVSGQYLLLPFSLLMFTVALMMLRKPAHSPTACTPERHASPAFIWGSILLLGILAGFMGIGGGFLVVPALVWFFRFSMVEAIATSLMVVFAMGISTSASYALAGKVSVMMTVYLIMGGLLGGFLGVRVASRLKKNTRAINAIFSTMLMVMASYMLIKNL